MENKYSYDQKEKALNKTKEYFINQGRPQGSIPEDEFEKKYQYFLEIMNRPFLPKYANKMITHPLDIEYFTDYPAPLMELIHSSQGININSTITFFSPMLYFLARAIGAEQVLEIGIAEGSTSWYLAHAVKDNAVRYKMAGNMYYGVDILDRTEAVKPRLDAAGLPNKLIQMDSINLTSETFKDVVFDLIFLDGCHDRDHIVHEAKVLYPQLKGKGNGFMVLHDVYGPGYDGCKEVIEDKNYNWEYVRISEIYGIALLRKMDGYVERNPWTP